MGLLGGWDAVLDFFSFLNSQLCAQCFIHLRMLGILQGQSSLPGAEGADEELGRKTSPAWYAMWLPCDWIRFLLHSLVSDGTNKFKQKRLRCPSLSIPPHLQWNQFIHQLFTSPASSFYFASLSYPKKYFYMYFKVWTKIRVAGEVGRQCPAPVEAPCRHRLFWQSRGPGEHRFTENV